MKAIQERNSKILKMRKDGVPGPEVARRFRLSPCRIAKIEQRDKADKSMAERRIKLGEDIRATDDPDRLLPVNDMADAIGLVGCFNSSLLRYFTKIGKSQISLRELMDMCVDVPVEGRNFSWPPLFKVFGIGKYGFRSVVNGLTALDLGSRCKKEWHNRLVTIKANHAVIWPKP